MAGARAALLIVLAPLAPSIPTVASAQVAPESPVHAAVNGVFVLCPKLVRDGAAPDSAELSKLGFAPSAPLRPGLTSFKSLGDKGVMYVSYENTNHRCVLDYAGPGYEQISGIVRDIVTRNGFSRVTGGDESGAKADVFEGPVPKMPLTARIIIIENQGSSTASISYAEKAAN